MAEAVVSTFIESFVGSLVHPIFDFLKYKSNFENMMREVGELNRQREWLQQSLEAATNNGEMITTRFQCWVENVDKFRCESDDVIQRFEEGNLRCCYRLFPNFLKCHRINKEVVRLLKVVAELLEQGKFVQVSCRPIPKETWTQTTKDFETFESRESAFRQIFDAFVDTDVDIVGVYGMGGIGKTMLVKEVGRNAVSDRLFDVVIFVEVSRTPDIRMIQAEIAYQLDLEFKEETVAERTRRLYARLMQERRFLLILDDVWAILDLQMIGIPLKEDFSRCKLLLTTRSRDVLHSMDSQLDFCIDILKEGESWSLFKKIAGDCVDAHDLQSVAIEVAKACGDVPMAISKVARKLRNKSIYEWKHVLQELKRSSFREFDGVREGIQFSYDYLESEELKSTFLLCSMMEYTNEGSIGDLLRYVMGWSSIENINTLEEAQDYVVMLVRKLKDCSLLVDTHNHERFSMHDFVRDTARSIASRHRHMFVLTDDSMLQNWANDNKLMECCTAISLHDVSVLPKRLVCPQLKFLYMKPKDPFMEVPDNFFTELLNLRVLHMIGMDLLSLPTSLCLLKNLRTLCMDQCKLGDVAIIGPLENLEILSFNSSHIEKLPREIGQLTKLRMLDLSDCSKLGVISPNVLSNLTRLEVLYMGNTSTQWAVEGLNNERGNASLEELKLLSDQMTTLEIRIGDAEAMPKNFFSKNLKAYKIVIGDNWDYCDWYKKYERTSKTLKLKLNASIHAKDFFMQFKGIRDLCLDEMSGVRDVHELDRKGFLELEHLQVQNNPCFLSIVLAVSFDAFPLLESLFLSNLINLEKICDGQLKNKFFHRLRTIEVQNCDKLKNIFSFSSIAEFLSELQEIKVTKCKNMEEIFAIEKEVDVNNYHELWVYPLRRMTLESLPHLTSFCSRKTPSSSQRRQKVLAADPRSNEIILEHELDISSLFNSKVVFLNLEALKLSALCVENIWHIGQPQAAFPNLTRLVIQGFGNLRYLFSSSIVGEFLLLQHLEICECNALEEIIGVEEEFWNWKNEFPHLNYMKLTDLENLRRFHSGNLFEFPSLKDLEIKNCPELKEFIFDDHKVGLPNLERMTISCMDNLESIWHNQFHSDSFSKLKSLEVNDCQKLMTIFSSSIRERFLRLESLTVKSCGLVEAIFQGQIFDHLEASQLRELYIDHLPNLNHIWNEDPQGMLSLENLQKVTIFLCPNLKYIFPASVARSLLKLECLDVSDCDVEEIVARGGEGEEAADKILFPQLSSMQLHCLPELKIFYPGHSVEWPYLKRLGLHHCDKVKVFISELDNPTQQPFLKREDLLSVEDLQLSGKATAMKWQGQVPEHLFGLLESLELNDDKSTDFSLDIIQRFHKLKKLSLNCSSYKEIFSHGDVEKRLPQIKHLVLSELYDLKRIWKQDSAVHLNFQNLEILEVRSCFHFINLMPSSASFRNLTILEVRGCEGLKNLFTTFTAKSLEQLEKLEVFDCKMMTEVVVNEEVVTDEITFKKLKRLSLLYLQSLASFCSVKHILKFPILESLVMNECPKMKIFSGVTSAPRLWKLELNWKVIEQSQEIDHIIQRLGKSCSVVCERHCSSAYLVEGILFPTLLFCCSFSFTINDVATTLAIP